MGWGGGGLDTIFFSEIGAEVGRFEDFGLSVHRSQTVVWERTGHSSNISSLQPKTIQGIMMYFDVPRSKMHERWSNKVFNSSNTPFSLTQ